MPAVHPLRRRGTNVVAARRYVTSLHTAYSVLATDNWLDLFQGGGITYEKGFALPPMYPGLGVGIDEAVAAKRPYKPHTRQQLRFPDGGIADHQRPAAIFETAY